jgi:predicted oxidoreductase
MERRKLHAQGPEFSRIIAGAWRWNLSEASVHHLIGTSLEQASLPLITQIYMAIMATKQFLEMYYAVVLPFAERWRS